MAKKDKSSEAKNKADKKGKKGKKGAHAEEAAGASIASHPRAQSSIRRIKAWAGIAGFAITALLSIQASVPLFQTGLRALGAGVIGYMLAWWVGVMLWRQLILAEQRAAYEKLQARRAAEAESSAEPARAEARSTA